MDTVTFGILAVVLVLVVAGIIGVLYDRRRLPASQTVNYRAYFIVGVVLLALGIALGFALVAVLESWWIPAMPLTVLGVVYIALGWSHKEEWPTG